MARKSGTVTAIDATHIVIDDTDEYELEKFIGLNERTCLNQRPIVKLGEKVKKGQIIADGGGTARANWRWARMCWWRLCRLTATTLRTRF